jgi:hypothetical protein
MWDKSSINSRERWEMGLPARLFAAWWFTVAAAVPVVFFSVVFDHHGNARWAAAHFYAVPLVAAAVLGFTFGASILDPLKVARARTAALKGMIVVARSYLLFTTALLLRALLPRLCSGEGQGMGGIGDLLGWFLFILEVGAVFVGWLILLAGAIAGALLFRLAERAEFRSHIVNPYRTTPRNARLMSLAAFTVFLLAAGAPIVITAFLKWR